MGGGLAVGGGFIGLGLASVGEGVNNTGVAAKGDGVSSTGAASLGGTLWSFGSQLWAKAVGVVQPRERGTAQTEHAAAGESSRRDAS